MNFIEIAVKSELDSGELLAMLDDSSAVLGSWEADGVIYLYYPEEKWDNAYLTDLKKGLARLGLEDREELLSIREVPDQDWNAVWVSSLQPVRIGRRIRIRQSWHPADEQFDGIELVIDPKRAFGTGYHATTQLVIEWLEDHIRGGERVLDVGTGSAILAMAAIRLGAASAMAIDIDPVAIECAREYGRSNGFGAELDLRVCSYETLEPGYDIILANMDIRSLPALCRHLPRLLNRGGTVCLSGLQPQDFDEIVGVLAETDLQIRTRTGREEWIALQLKID
jgi:ribosomal protein L11 methyltransferase